nr:MAG TPA: hypothetical protein [Caudoviricetes sp.]
MTVTTPYHYLTLQRAVLRTVQDTTSERLRIHTKMQLAFTQL